MGVLELSGYIAAFMMGATLGTIGGGGSILTVPILVYLMGVAPVTATGYSLLIVGSAAAFGAFRYYHKGLVDIKASIIFALPSIATVYLARAWLMPALPDPLLTVPFEIGKDIAIMVLFALLMIVAAGMMLRNSMKAVVPRDTPHHPGLVMIEGAVVGLFTGILGAGGGFLIIPALVLLMGMPMAQAVGASLFIIALKSLIGFVGDIQTGIALQMPMLAIFFFATFAGMYSATFLSHKINETALKRGFAVFTLAVAAIILGKELL